MYEPIKFIISNLSDNPDPAYATEGSSGMDLRAYLDVDKHHPDRETTLASWERKLIPTGIYLEIPKGYEAQIRSRSGCTLKQGLIVMNEPGTIDSDYRGEIKLIMWNGSDVPVTIKNGDRIAQMIFAKVEDVRDKLIITKQPLSEDTERGSGGFGHTGTH